MEQMQELIEKLNYYTKLYDEGHPAISDQDWDNMYFHLQELEKTTGIYLPNSPTQKIDYKVVNKLNKVQHNHPMLSLDKTKDINEILSFINNRSFIGMAKMDGLTCSLRYINGKLVSAETRGNGVEGEDILHNALAVKNIPNRINFTDELILDGEIICTYENFKPFENEYKNPRNFASGSIRLLDNKESASRNLTFVVWDVIKGLDFCKTLSEKLYQLKDIFNSFTIVPYFIGGIGSDINDLEQQIEFIKKECQDLGYPIDGMVFKLDECAEYEAAGKTDHHFKGGLAYKFYDEEYETTLKDIEWTMGRTGVLTPVAILNPVEIDGTEVSRASLHNVSVMEETLHGTGWIGQRINVAKMNMIIPQIMSAEDSAPDYEDDYLLIPITCPICDGVVEIIQENESKVLYCTSPNCEGKLINRIDHFFGKKGLDAKGLSKATIEKLINWGWVNNISDVFRLDAHQTDWQKKEGFGVKSVNNIITSIRESCNTNLDAIISAAGIPLIGRTVSKQIANEFTTYENFREAVRAGYDFTSLDGFGYELNKSLKNFNYNELDYIVENYLTIQNKIEANNNNKKLENLTFCITGKITNWKNRDELVKYIEDLGGKCVSSVSANVNYLINNDIESTSAKNKKAKELNIEIIDEQTFIKKFDLQK
jgi:DNA ligase (NAD+)